MSLKPGTYQIVNVKSNTVVDLWKTDANTITGWQINGGDHQKWHAETDGDTWTFKNKLYPNKFIGVAGNRACPGVDIQAAEIAREWKLIPNGPYYEIAVPDYPDPGLRVDLKDGASGNGTPISLEAPNGEGNQLWAFKTPDVE